MASGQKVFSKKISKEESKKALVKAENNLRTRVLKI